MYFVNNSISKMQKNLGLFLLIGAIGFYFYRRAASTQNIKPVLRKITFGGTLIQPKIFVGGHIHSGYGYKFDGHTHFFNASVLNERYNYENKPHHPRRPRIASPY